MILLYFRTINSIEILCEISLYQIFGTLIIKKITNFPNIILIFIMKTRNYIIILYAKHSEF